MKVTNRNKKDSKMSVQQNLDFQKGLRACVRAGVYVRVRALTTTIYNQITRHFIIRRVKRNLMFNINCAHSEFHAVCFVLRPCTVTVLVWVSRPLYYSGDVWKMSQNICRGIYVRKTEKDINQSVDKTSETEAEVKTKILMGL